MDKSENTGESIGQITNANINIELNSNAPTDRAMRWQIRINELDAKYFALESPSEIDAQRYNRTRDTWQRWLDRINPKTPMATPDNVDQSKQVDATGLKKRAARWQAYIDDLDNEHAALVDPSDDIIKKYNRTRSRWQDQLNRLVAEISEISHH